MTRTVYEALAHQAVAKAHDAYDAADETGNPYARTLVTEILAQGDLVSLPTARGVVRRYQGLTEDQFTHQLTNFEQRA